MAPNHLPVILFPFPFCSPVLLPNPVAFSVLPFFCCHSFLLTFIPHNVLHYFSLRDRPFSMALVEQLRCGMCSLLPYGTGVCHTFSYNCILLLFLAIPSAPLSLSLSLIWHLEIRWKGWCAFFSLFLFARAVLKEITLKTCV